MRFWSESFHLKHRKNPAIDEIVLFNFGIKYPNQGWRASDVEELRKITKTELDQALHNNSGKSFTQFGANDYIDGLVIQKINEHYLIWVRDYNQSYLVSKDHIRTNPEIIKENRKNKIDQLLNTL